MHSATLKYQVAVGSAVGAQDKMAFKDVPASFTILDGEEMELQNGQSYSVAIKVSIRGNSRQAFHPLLPVCVIVKCIRG